MKSVKNERNLELEEAKELLEGLESAEVPISELACSADEVEATLVVMESRNGSRLPS